MIYRSRGDLAGKWLRRLVAVLLFSGVMFPGISVGEEQTAAPIAAEADAASQVQPAAQPAKPEELVWPAPPEQPRIRYLGSIHNPEDLGRKKGFWRKVWDFVRGEDENEDVVRPMAVAVDNKDRVIIADSGRGRVHIFDRQTSEYSYIRSAELESLQLPVGVATDAKGNIYVADGEHGKIFVFKPDGSYDSDLDSPKWLMRPSGLAIDKARQRLYVADTPSHDVKVFDLEKRAVLKTIGERGDQNGEFNYPAFVAVDKAGRLYVTDALNSRIQVFDLDGRFLMAFGKKGDGTGDLSAPKGVGVDSEGHIYVADADFDNLQIFDEKGRLLLFLGSSGQAAGKFWLPTGLFVDDRDRIYVADSYNKRVQIFQYLGKQAMAEVKK